MLTFLLDNSALNLILKDDDKTQSVINLVKNGKSRVVVSFDTLYENFGGETEFVITRVPRLKKLVEFLPHDRFIIAKPGRDWLDVEKRNNGRLKNIPTQYNTQRWHGFLEYLKDIEEFERLHRSLEQSRKDTEMNDLMLIERDHQFREKGKQLLPQNEVLYLLENFNLNPKTFKANQLALALKLSSRKAKAILSSPKEKYKIHKAWLAAFYLRSIGNAFSQYNKNAKYSFLSEIKKGNWPDLGIIAQSSQFDHLVSNDKDQRKICNFLSEKGIFRATAIDLKTFFEKLSDLSEK